MRSPRRPIGITRFDLVGLAVLLLVGAAAWGLVRASTLLVAPPRIRIADSERPVIGVAVKKDPAGGLRIQRAVSPAREAGIRVGDRLLELDGVPLESIEQLASAVAGSTPGQVFRLAGRRNEDDGSEVSFLVTVEVARRRISPADEGLAYEDVAFPNPSGLTLRGWWIPAPARPDGRPAPVVVYGHGNGTDRRHWLPAAPRVHRSGVGQLLFDFAGRGESDGEVISLGAHEAGDLRAALDFLAGRPGIDPSRAALAGRSMGAVAAILAAAEDPRVRALVLDSPFADLGDLVDSQMARHHLPPALLRKPLFLLAGWRAGFDPDGVRPERAIPRVTIPILLFHGDSDELVPLEHAHRLEKAARGPVTFVPIPGAGHNGPRPDEVNDRIGTFFDHLLEP